MKKILLAMRVVYEGEEIKYDMSVGDGRMTIKWLGELSYFPVCASRLLRTKVHGLRVIFLLSSCMISSIPGTFSYCCSITGDHSK